MAKINHVKRENAWQVQITVNDPHCTWNVNPTCSYYRIVKANNARAAIRGAATYCSKQMDVFPGVHFKYSAQDVKPYFCSYTPKFERDDEE